MWEKAWSDQTISDWTAVYVADIGYTFGYYQELIPAGAKLALLNARLKPPQTSIACELGFGQGLSINLHAAASDVQWFGTDFNPAQAGIAQELAAVCGSGAQLFDQAFADFSQRADLPEFDFIGLHGIWSWISDENRTVIVDFVRRKLKVGGVLYISYNTLPGWGTFAPMRHLMTEHAEIIGADGVGIVSRIDGALDFTEKLLATNPLFARANPLIAERISKIKGQNRHYLAHEYFNRDWHPMHFGTMAKWLEPAKLTYACSSYYLDYVEAVNLTPEQQTFLADIHDPMFKQTVQDFMVNQQFRRDYWVKGARRLTLLEQAQGFRDQRLIMAAHRPDVTLKVTGALGEATLTDAIYNPILDLMADLKIRSIAQIEQDVKATGITFPQLIQALLVLCGNETLSAVQHDTCIAKAKKHTDKLNTHLMLRASCNNDISYLASPVTGGGIMVGRFQQLFVLAMQKGKKKPEELAAYIWEILASQGQKILKAGKPLETPEEHLVELNAQAHEFAVKQLSIFKALQLV